MNSTESTTKKSKKETSKDFSISLVIAASSFILYAHDSGCFKGMEGFSGFSSLRIAIWVVSMFIMALMGWIFAFMNSAGKGYRYAMLIPIILLSYQLGIYLFDARATTTNEFTVKTILHITLTIVIIALNYAIRRRLCRKNT